MKRKKKAETTDSQKSTLDVKSYLDLDNRALMIIGAMEDRGAREEILKRHIMSVDGVPYELACETFWEIRERNRRRLFLLSLPYKIGIFTALSAAALSFPLVFDLGTVEWFNTNYVTADVPEPKDLETPLEVGTWAWNWMEPPLGQISSGLLCLQHNRCETLIDVLLSFFFLTVLSDRAGHKC
jgi:hypothetical protein